MDIFQLIGDLMHLFSLLMFLIKMLGSKNVIGMSYKTQEIYMVVFLTRYSSMFFINHWGSLYFNIMRIVFIAITAAIIRIMRFKRPYKLVPPSTCRAMTNHWMLSRITIFTPFHLSSRSPSTTGQLLLVSSGRFRYGCRPLPSYHSWH